MLSCRYCKDNKHMYLVISSTQIRNIGIFLPASHFRRRLAMERAQNVKRADPVNRSVHTLLTNQHTVSASDMCVNVYKMCNKGQPC